MLSRADRTLVATATGLVVLVGLVSWLVWSLDPRRPNLARGAKVLVSSYSPEVRDVQRLVDGDLLALGMHTQIQDRPWAMLDLGREQTVSQVRVYNRIDRAVGRARGLKMEVSTDGVRFTSIAQRNDDFRLWDQHFPPMRVRYVRLLLPRRDYLHLREVEVFR